MLYFSFFEATKEKTNLIQKVLKKNYAKQLPIM